MGAARSLARVRFAAFVICAGGMLLGMPASGLAAGWTTSPQVVAQAGASSVSIGLDGASNATALWADANGIETSVRPAATMTWGATTALAASGTTPDVAVAVDGEAVATWVGNGGTIWASVRIGASWNTPTAVSVTGSGSAPQAAIAGGIAHAFWIDGASIEHASATSGGMWGSAASPAGATPPAGTLSHLRVALAPDGSGVAAWVRNDTGTFTIETALIGSPSSWTLGPVLSSGADASSTVAAVDGSGRTAVAWSEPVSGVHVATYNGSSFTAEAASAGASLPELAVDASGRVFWTFLSGSSLSTRLRAGDGSWSAAASLASGALSSSSASDTAGDVVVIWPTLADVRTLAYDASPPTLTITTPTSPSPPGDHTWTVNSSDLWSSANPSGAAWSFSPGGTQHGASVLDPEQIPGTVTATVSLADSAGNTGTSMASITISPVPPSNTQVSIIGGGSAPVDGGTLTVQTAGTWSGNPTPSITSVWQSCTTGQVCADLASNSNGSYTLKPADVGKRIRIEERASNVGGSGAADSAETTVVKPISSGAAPGLTISSSAATIADGVQLTATPGAWNGASNLAFTYIFQSCDPGCSTLQSGPTSTYTLGPDSVGANVQVQVTATAGPTDGLSAQATATSSQLGVVAPKATAAPGLSGGTQDTQTLTATSPPASWDGATGLALTYAFSRCHADGSSCSVQQSTGSPTYTLSSGDIGSTIKVTAMATASDSAHTVSGQIASSSSALSAVIAPHLKDGTHVAAPTPTDSSLVQDTVTLTASPGTWDDQAGLTPSYQFFQCTSPPSGCTAVSDPSSSPTYVLQPTDVGRAMEVVVTESKNGASTSATSDATDPAQPLSDGNPAIAIPAVQQDQQQFTSSDGSWHGATGLDLSYQWKRCNVALACSPISGAIDKIYRATAADVGNTLRVTVSASAGGSSVTPSIGDSPPTSAIAPLSTTLPTLAGAPADTKTLTVSDGSWDGVSNLTEAYEFLRCDAAGSNCSTVLQNSASSTYALVFGDIGSTIRVVVFAHKNSSATIAGLASSMTSVITPLSTGAPAAPSGAAQDGQVMTASDGQWADQDNPALQFRYQWYRCTPSCQPIAGATAKTYTLQATDVGARLSASTTAFVGAGAATTPSPQSSLAVSPVNTSVSNVSTPLARDGQIFSTSSGEWDGAAGLTYTYRWKRCAPDGGTCVSIVNATSSTYTAGPGDVGFTLRSNVSASKGTSALAAPIDDSSPTAVVAPRNTTRPVIAGDPTDGSVLSTDASMNTSWDSTPATLVFAYQWFRCDASGQNCGAIMGETNPTYTLTPDDVAAIDDPAHGRHKIEVQVTATVNGSSTTSTSDITGIVAAKDTVITTLPHVSGGGYSHQGLFVNPGSWSGTGVVYQDYQWESCDQPLGAPVCTNLGPASLSALGYTVQDSDVGHYVTVIETVVNRLGESKSVRAPFGVPILQNQFGIVDGGDPTVAGTYVDGSVLRATSGTWTQPDGVVFSFSWRRCGPNPSGSAPGGSATCPTIPHATSSTYTLTPDDVGKWVVVQVRGDYAPASTYGIFDSEIEALPAVKAAPPVSTARPAIAGTPAQGAVLTASAGSWNGTNAPAVPMTFTYQWSRCDADGTTCQAIAGMTGKTYTVTATDVGLRILVRVTAANLGGSASTVSDATDLVAAPASAATGAGGSAPGLAGTGSPSVTPSPIRASSTDRTRPRLTLSFVGGGTLLRGTTLRVNARCPKTETSCKARFQLLAVIKKPTGKAVAKPVVIAVAHAVLKSGQKKQLQLKLSSAARTVLRKRLKLNVTLIANVVDAAGNVTPRESKGITLRWKKA